jgi:quercetin dioxygenase-like cupin family protein
MSAARTGRLTLFDFDEATPLADTDMMSMPTLGDDSVGWDTVGEWAGSAGHVVKVLYRGEGDDGFSLVWSWFGPHYTLPRHSHSADRLDHVVRGEARLGNRVVRAGSGFFVPADAPDAYSAGPDGTEILVFRNATSFDMKISESAARWQAILDGARANADVWAAEAPAYH